MMRAHCFLAVLAAGCTDPDAGPDPIDGSTWIGTYEVLSSLESRLEGSTVPCGDEPRTPNDITVVTIKPFEIDPDSLDVEACTADGLCETLDIFRPAEILEHAGAFSVGDDSSMCILRADRNRATLDDGLLHFEGREWSRTFATSPTCSFEQAHALLDTPNCERVFTIDARRRD